MSKFRSALDAAAPYLGGIPGALALAYGAKEIANALSDGLKAMATSSEKGAEKISEGVKEGMVGLMSAEGAGKQHLADGLEHLSDAIAAAVSSQDKNPSKKG